MASKSSLIDLTIRKAQFCDRVLARTISSGWICTLHPNRVVIAYELDFFADTSNTQVAYINSYSYQGLAYRHGGDVSFTKPSTTQFKYNGNAVNMNYMDGHAETVSRSLLDSIANNTLIFREGIDYMDRKPVK